MLHTVPKHGTLNSSLVWRPSVLLAAGAQLGRSSSGWVGSLGWWLDCGLMQWLPGAALSFSRAPSHSRSLQPQGSPAGDAGLLVPGLPNTWVWTNHTSLPPHAVGQAGTSAAES